jgi:hypothetical protein
MAVYSFPRITQYAPHTALSWSGTDAAGQKLPAGMYLIELKEEDKVARTKVVLAG